MKCQMCVKANCSICPLTEALLGLEHSSLSKHSEEGKGGEVAKWGGALHDCSLEQEGGVEERGWAWYGGWRGESGRENSSVKHLGASSTTVHTPKRLPTPTVGSRSSHPTQPRNG